MSEHFTCNGMFIHPFHKENEPKIATYFVPKHYENKDGNICMCGDLQYEYLKDVEFNEAFNDYREHMDCKHYTCWECVLDADNKEIFKRFKRVKNLEKINGR